MSDMDEEVKTRFPKKFCDHWLEKPKTWEIKRTEECGYCPEPISEGDEYFEINVNEDEVKRGHLHHLEYAEVIEWIPKEPTQ